MSLGQDLRYALRTLRASPVFTAVAILSLALGIGANTAIFSLLDQVLLRPLPLKDPARLVLLDSPGPNTGFFAGSQTFSYPMYRDLRDNGSVFSGVTGRFATSLGFHFSGSTERIVGELVAGNYFDVLGVTAHTGRLLTPEDDRLPGAHPLVVLSHSFWKQRFSGDTSILDKTVY